MVVVKIKKVKGCDNMVVNRKLKLYIPQTTILEETR